MSLEREFLELVLAEEVRADVQHGLPADIYEMLTILGEEYGELQQAVLQFDYGHAPIENALRECIQVGAMALKTYMYLQLTVGTTHRIRRGDR